MNNKDENLDYSRLYPSSRLLKDVCSDEYKRLMDLYDHIYEKTNIALAFSGVVLLVILSGFDYTVIKGLCSATKQEIFLLSVFFLCSIMSAVGIVWAVIELLIILHGKPLPMLDCDLIRNEELYRECEEVTATWLIDKYTRMIPRIKKRIERKQRKFDSAVSKIVIAIICYSIALIVQKGV